MVKIANALLVVGCIALPHAALSNQSSTNSMRLIEYSSPMLPPSNYKGQWWTSPENCEYSRAGRPGETVWYLIVNTAHMKCPKRLIQKAYSDFN